MAGFLKQQFPECRITFLVRAYAQAVAGRCCFVDSVITLESLHDPVAQLTAGNFDVALFAFPHRKLAQAAKRAKIRWRVGTGHRLYHWLYCNKLAHFSRVNSSLHEAQLNFALLKPLGIEVTPGLSQITGWYGLTSPANGGAPSPALSRPERFRNNCFNLILHPKSNGNGREWPAGHYLELARQLQDHPAIRLWISGSQHEGEQLAQAVPALFALPNVTSLCGQCTLAQFTDLIAASDGLIASGTGPLHMAASLDRRTLGLFPPLKPIDIARWGAVGSRAENMCKPQACPGCPGAQDCACMAALTVEQVKGVVLGWAGKPND